MYLTTILTKTQTLSMCDTYIIAGIKNQNKEDMPVQLILIERSLMQTK